MIRSNSPIIITLIALLWMISACSPHPYIPEGEQFYLGVKEIKVKEKQGGRHEAEVLSEVKTMLSYKPNGYFLGVRFPFTYGFYFDKTFNNSSTFFGRWLYKTLGTKPKFISTVNPEGRATIATRILEENGYFHSDVDAYVLPKANDSLQAKVGYQIKLGTPYVYDSIEFNIPIRTLDSVDLFAPKERLIEKGDYFSVTKLESERERISELLRSRGYYFFKANNIIYTADTVKVPGKVQLRIALSEKTLPQAYQPWRIGKISYNLHDGTGRPLTDSVMYRGILFRYNGTPPVKLDVLRPRIRIDYEDLYNLSYQNRTTALMSYLNTFSYTDVAYTPMDTIDNWLNVTLSSVVDKPYFSELEATFKSKSNNQVGPGLSFTVSKKNVFRGGELLSLSAGASYEWETNRRSGGRSWDINSYQFSLSSTLTLPRVYLPWIMNTTYFYPASTKLSLSGELLNRGQFYRLGQFAGTLSYQFEPTKGLRHTFTPARLAYNHLLRRTERFDSIIADNPILSLAFQNQFIAGAGYLFAYEKSDPDSHHAFGIEANISEAGNLIGLLHQGKPQDRRPFHILGAPYAQFVKGTLELRYNYRFGPHAQIASRFFGGAVYSYGNADVAPYTEQFYAGGANSIRGFNVRSIGPGSYIPKVDDQYAFLDRTGDLRFEANVEYRYRVLGGLELATFIDAGNVWLIRPDVHRAGGAFKLKDLAKDIALGTGLGIRYDLSYLVLRLDAGVALHAPFKDRKKYFNTFDSNDWFAFHFAIGYPF
ncbi:BamA/TamA family outer membrane protein [Porphyromonas sp.]|uniref:translocation and assembly module lipoprotein TamL n=1 Tax=Porphyromonas sp. TaxID=1924944 RepID=UPI0026DA9147|nr:BamA/TamA family outer membrane protein [Porphyromonas sp.]MDO4771578.1 BamA/TamA family outer membrane protein [Porphyromonas sp.]